MSVSIKGYGESQTMNPLAASLTRKRTVTMGAADNRIRILLVDDHPIMREGIAAVLGTEADMLLVAEASNGSEAIEHEVVVLRCLQEHPLRQTLELELQAL